MTWTQEVKNFQPGTVECLKLVRTRVWFPQRTLWGLASFTTARLAIPCSPPRTEVSLWRKSFKLLTQTYICVCGNVIGHQKAALPSFPPPSTHAVPASIQISQAKSFPNSQIYFIIISLLWYKEKSLCDNDKENRAEAVKEGHARAALYVQSPLSQSTSQMSDVLE